jgi:hypothetical protein
VGWSSRAILINKDHISAIAYDGSGRVTSITVAAGKSYFFVDGIKQSLKPKYAKADTPAGNAAYKHTAEFFYFAYDQVSKNNMMRMANGKWVVIFQNAKQDDTAFEVLGLDAGLEVKEMVRAPQENGGAVKITLETAEEEFESKLPPTFYDGTSFASTKSVLELALNLPTITSFTPTSATAAGGTAITVTGTKFYAGTGSASVLKVEWINNATGAVVNQTTFTNSADVTITCSTVAMVAGNYRLRVTTTRGQAESTTNLIVT